MVGAVFVEVIAVWIVESASLQQIEAIVVVVAVELFVDRWITWLTLVLVLGRRLFPSFLMGCGNVVTFTVILTTDCVVPIFVVVIPERIVEAALFEVVEPVLVETTFEFAYLFLG